MNLPAKAPRHYSHLTQQVLNYFDPADVRVRENRVTLDAQLLNPAAAELEDLERRLDRGIGAGGLATVPLHIDNRGLYYQVRIPASFVLPRDSSGAVLPPALVEAELAGNWIPLTEYDDRLPVPTRVEVDPSQSAVALSDPVLTTLTGTGNPQSLVLGTLNPPNRLHFWVDQMGAVQAQVQVVVRGEIFPRPAWVGQRRQATESLLFSGEGYFATRSTWETAEAITVHGLPVGARLRVYGFPFQLPAVPDPARPFTHPGFRDVLFPRFWRAEGLLLQELYFPHHFAGFEYVQSYRLPAAVSAVAVEPHTAGLFAASGTNLYYSDRREPLPERLDRTMLMVEPLWGLDVGYDVEQAGEQRHVRITPVPYARAEEVVQYRYLVEDPSGETVVLNAEGIPAAFSGMAGWRRGAPLPLSMPVSAAGTYVITLETRDRQNRVTQDNFPYANLDFTPAATLDVSRLVPDIQGLAFDSRERLWVWTGDFAVPLRLHYDAFLFDAAQRSLFLTDSYPRVRLT